MMVLYTTSQLRLNKACSFRDPYDLTVNIRYELAIKDYGFYYTRLSLG